jgi:hypothetical protein
MNNNTAKVLIVIFLFILPIVISFHYDSGWYLFLEILVGAFVSETNLIKFDKN